MSIEQGRRSERMVAAKAKRVIACEQKAEERSVNSKGSATSE